VAISANAQAPQPLLALSRQARLANQANSSAARVAKGAYVLEDCVANKPELILIGSGTELDLCRPRRPQQLSAEGRKVRVSRSAASDCLRSRTPLIASFGAARPCVNRVVVKLPAPSLATSTSGFDGAIRLESILLFCVLLFFAPGAVLPREVRASPWPTWSHAKALER